MFVVGCGFVFSMPAFGQVTYTYENLVNGTLGTANCGTGTGGTTRDFVVSETFSVGASGTIALGIEIEHPDRDNLQVFLDPPGTAGEITLFNQGTIEFDPPGPPLPRPVVNLFATFVAASEAGDEATEATDDPVTSRALGAVPYRRLIQQTALAITPQAANGTWRLRVCDDDGTIEGTLVRARLILRDNAATAPTNVCGSEIARDWGANGNQTAFPVAPTSFDLTGGVSVQQISRWTPAANGPTGDARESYETCTGTGPTDNPADARCNWRLGGHQGYYKFSMDMRDDGSTKPNVEQATFQFSVPVLGLNLLGLDIDQQTGGNPFEDMFRVEGYAGTGATGASVPYQLTLVSLTPTAQIAGDWVEADADAAPYSNANGNVRVRFAAPVRSIRVTYAQGNAPASNSLIQYIGISDFSFCAFDYGDAPSSYGVTLGSNGPRHVLGNRALFVGAVPDGEADGAASTSANSDDGSNADEGGSLPFGIPAYVPQGGQVCDATAGGGGTYTTAAPPGINPNEPGQYCLVVNVTNNSGSPASLVGWIDFNGDGDFSDAGERSNAVLESAAVGTFIGGNLPSGVTNGQRILVWTNVDPGGSAGPTVNQTYLRLRLSTDSSFTGTSANPSPVGLAADGEVEDHVVTANTLPVTLAQIDVQRVDPATLSIGWTTATETGTRGFRVLQQQADRTVAAISQRLVPSARMSTTRPSDYRIRVTTTSNAPIYLEEVAVNGKTERFGPFAVGASVGARPQVSPPAWSVARSEVTVATTREDGARRARAAQRGTGPAAEVRVAKTGWQQVPVSTLSAVGIDFVGQPVAGLRLRRGETSVPFRVASGSATLGASSVIEFWGEAVEGNLYTTVRPYLLDVGAGGQLMAVEDGTPLPGPAATLGSAERALDDDRDYSVTSPNGDPWYFDMITRDGAATAGKQWTLDLPGLDTAAPARVSLALWGGVGIPELAQDHRYRLTINGSVIGEDGFDGVMAHERLFDVPAGVLVAGANTVRLDLIDTGDSFDRVFIERIAIAHTARLSAVDGHADVESSGFLGVQERVFADGLEDEPIAAIACGVGCEQIDVVGLQSSDVLALRLTSTGAAELSGVAVRPVAGGYAARVRSAAIAAGGGDGGPEAGRIIVVDRSRAAQPAVRPAIALDDPAIGGPNDLMIIASTRFAGSVGDLVAAREAEGLRVRVVTVEQIYAHYSDGIVDPEGIRRFVARAAQQLGTRYVLLVGGDTYDYFDRYATGSISDVPTLYRKTHEYVSFAPVDPAFGDVDYDGRPDVSVGRLPARTTAELQSLIAKVLEPLPANAYTGLFAAERSNPAEGIDYDARVTDWVSALGPAWQSGMSRLNLDDYPATAAGTLAARNEFVGQVNQGRNWVSYYGHASPATWSRETLLDADFLPGLLNNVGKSPVVTEFGCWGGYFVEPTYTTLNHAWLLSPGRGARAMIASSSLTEAQSDQAIAAALVPQFSTPGIRLGDALLNAQGAVYSTRSEMKDVIYGMSLFGDPSARLTPPN